MPRRGGVLWRGYIKFRRMRKEDVELLRALFRYVTGEEPTYENMLMFLRDMLLRILASRGAPPSLRPPGGEEPAGLLRTLEAAGLIRLGGAAAAPPQTAPSSVTAVNNVAGGEGGGAGEEDEEGLPSYLRDNPWLEVLSRYGRRSG